MKELDVTHGPVYNPQFARVQLPGVPEDERLTPKLAAQAARIACGHRDGVTVIDAAAGYGYRLYQNSARKFEMEV